jgi:glycosyltransferase involved in cell wall biosynthesis
MVIGIDGNEANEPMRVGVHKYAFDLLWGLFKLQDKKFSSHLFIIYLKNPPSSDLPPENSYWKYRIIPGSKLWVLTKLMWSLMTSENVDVFFSPSHYLPLFTRSSKVCTIHDLGYLKFSEQFEKYDFWQLKYWSAISVIISKYIISPSKSTAEDIVRHYPFARKKIRVVYHGYDEAKFTTKVPKKHVLQITKKYRISRNYLLFLSTLKPSKNVEGLLEGFKILKKKSRWKELNKVRDVQLVIAGKKGWMYQRIFNKVKELKLENDVVFTDYVKDDDKPALFAGAKAFVLPSFWEGFGMDVLSSLACGIPVVVSNVASLTEVAGKAGIYVDPSDPASISEGMAKALTLNNVEYNSLVQLGLEHVKNFSWDKAARETLNILSKA